MTKILPKLPKPLIAFSAVLLSLGMASATAAPNFYDDYNRAVAAAKAENKPMVVVFISLLVRVEDIKLIRLL